MPELLRHVPVNYEVCRDLYRLTDIMRLSWHATAARAAPYSQRHVQ